MWSQHGTARISAIGGVLAVLLATVGCTAQVGNGPIAPTTPAASQTSFGSVTPKSGAPSISNEAEGPISYSPDNMWGFLATAPGEVRRADDLAGAVAFSKLVVVGRYVGVEKGPGYGPAGGGIGWYAVAVIKVESVLKGTPILGPDGNLRVPFLLVMGADRYPEKEFADLQGSIPVEPALLYLYSWAAYFDLTDGDPPTWLNDLDSPAKYKTIGADGAFRIVAGEVQPPDYLDGWPVECRGVTIEDMMWRVRALGDRPAASAKPSGVACSS